MKLKLKSSLGKHDALEIGVNKILEGYKEVFESRLRLKGSQRLSLETLLTLIR